MAVEFTVCPDPDCLLPAEVWERFEAESTAGPIVEVVTVCVARHRYTTVEETPCC